jgi:hypothetical protein
VLGEGAGLDMTKSTADGIIPGEPDLIKQSSSEFKTLFGKMILRSVVYKRREVSRFYQRHICKPRSPDVTGVLAAGHSGGKYTCDQEASGNYFIYGNASHD